MTMVTIPGPQGPGFFGKLRQWWGHSGLVQAVVIAGVFGLLWWFGLNMAAAFDKAGIHPGFDFLTRAAGFEIGETPIPFKAGDPYARAILVGLINTIKVALLGCVFATLLGVGLGVARLSGNLLLASVVRWYVEVVRNTPLLLQLFFWSALTHAFPAPRQAIAAPGGIFLSNRGIFLPGFSIGDVSPTGIAALIALPLLALLLGIVLRRRSSLTVPRGLGLILLVPLLALGALALTGTPILFEAPELKGFNIRGGFSLTPEFAGLLIGLIVKFSAGIAEIVRTGIEAVDEGQWEAARALGLHNGQIMRLVVLPQALRVIVPLITSTYLDLTKDSSLAVAVGYPDLVNVLNTTANTTGQSLEALAIMVVTYLALNLTVSALMNRYNRHVALLGERA